MRDKRRLLLVDAEKHENTVVIHWIEEMYIESERLGEMNGKLVLRFQNKHQRDHAAKILKELPNRLPSLETYAIYQWVRGKVMQDAYMGITTTMFGDKA